MDTNMLNLSETEAWLTTLCVCLVVWELVRKAIALYKAWQNSHKIRFIFIFILNTCGILPIVYLLLNKKKSGH